MYIFKSFTMNQSVLGKLVDIPFCIVFLPLWHPPTSGATYSVYCWIIQFRIYLQVLSCIGEGNGNPLQCSCLENPREPGGLPSMGSHRVGHDWSNLAAAAMKRAVDYETGISDPPLPSTMGNLSKNLHYSTCFFVCLFFYHGKWEI